MRSSSASGEGASRRKEGRGRGAANGTDECASFHATNSTALEDCRGFKDRDVSAFALTLAYQISILGLGPPVRGRPIFRPDTETFVRRASNLSLIGPVLVAVMFAAPRIASAQGSPTLTMSKDEITAFAKVQVAISQAHDSADAQLARRATRRTTSRLSCKKSCAPRSPRSCTTTG